MTLNCNGIRAAARKGFFDWLQTQDCDVVCLQETRAQEYQLTDPVFHPEMYHCYYFDAVKKGYAGTAVYCKQEPKKVIRGLGFEIADSEGRYIQADYVGLSIASLYLPSGSAGEERQRRKFHFMDDYMRHMKSLRKKRREFIICADWNICHKKIDLKNWRSNQKNSGFLPEEREWMDRIINNLGYIDAFRETNNKADEYSWWSNRGRAREKNVGWRIDYQLVSENLKSKILKAVIYRKKFFSDHAPLIINYSLKNL